MLGPDIFTFRHPTDRVSSHASRERKKVMNSPIKSELIEQMSQSQFSLDRSKEHMQRAMGKRKSLLVRPIYSAEIRVSSSLFLLRRFLIKLIAENKSRERKRENVKRVN